MLKASPPIPWVGGKRYMVRHLLGLMPPHHTYVEPFGGAAWLLLAKSPSPIEVYNDIHSGIVTLYRVVRDPQKCQELKRLLEWTPYSREEYELCRITWRDVEDEIERARRFFVSIRQAFGGKEDATWGYAVSAGESSVSSTWRSAIQMLEQVQRRLAEVYIEHDDFRNLIPRYDTPHTLFYCDPPYLPETVRFSAYSHDMSAEEHEQLLRLLNGVKGMVMLSGYDSDLYRRYLDDSGWSRYEFEVPCSVVGKTRGSGLQGDGAIRERAQYRVEVVWCNPAAERARQALQLRLL